MAVRTLVAAMVSTGALTGAAFAVPASPAGAWITATGNLEIAIAPCDEMLCGDVTRVIANVSMTGANAMAAAPARPGLRILSSLRADGDGWRGKIYNRENRRTYDCRVRKLTDGSLEVRPYVVAPLFGQTQIWRPAS